MIAASTSKIVYTGDGVTTTFSYPMVLPSGSTGSELNVYVFDNLGNSTLLTGNYTVNVAAGTVSYPTVGGVSPLGVGVNALPATWQLVIARVVPLSQLLAILTQGVFDGPSFTAALDRAIMICQQLQEQLNRATLVPINTPGPAAAVVAPTVAAVGVVQVNATWAQLVAYAALNPTGQFFGLVTSGDLKGSQFFYSGDITDGNNGFISVGGG